MLHRHRRWTVAIVRSPRELAELLTEWTWCCCNGFRVQDTPYLFLNDATGPDGAQEYAVIKQHDDGTFFQVASVTFSWLEARRARVAIHDLLGGKYDHQDTRSRVCPILESAAEHGHCPHCA